jgi:hypothetical protein
VMVLAEDTARYVVVVAVVCVGSAVAVVASGVGVWVAEPELVGAGVRGGVGPKALLVSLPLLCGVELPVRARTAPAPIPPMTCAWWVMSAGRAEGAVGPGDWPTSIRTRARPHVAVSIAQTPTMTGSRFGPAFPRCRGGLPGGGPSGGSFRLAGSPGTVGRRSGAFGATVGSSVIALMLTVVSCAVD